MPRKKKENPTIVPSVIDVPTEESELSPAEYFEKLKGKRETMTDEKLNQVYDNAMTLMKRYKITGQKLAIKKLMFYVDKIEKERGAVFCAERRLTYHQSEPARLFQGPAAYRQLYPGKL